MSMRYRWGAARQLSALLCSAALTPRSRPREGELMRLAMGGKILNGQNYPKESGGGEVATCKVLGWEPDSGTDSVRHNGCINV